MALGQATASKLLIASAKLIHSLSMRYHLHSIRFSPLHALIAFTVVILLVLIIGILSLKESFLPLHKQREDAIKSIERAPRRPSP
jgi:hypothetical protein